MLTDKMTIWKETETMYPGEITYVPRPGSTEEDDGKFICTKMK